METSGNPDKLTEEELKFLARLDVKDPDWVPGNMPTYDEWETFCQQVKERRNGGYPSDWYEKVIAAQKVALLQAWWQG